MRTRDDAQRAGLRSHGLEVEGELDAVLVDAVSIRMPSRVADVTVGVGRYTQRILAVEPFCDTT